MPFTRRSMLKAAAIGAASSVLRPLSSLAAAVPSASPAEDRQFHGLRVGVCTYSLRSFPLADTLQSVKRLGVHIMSLKDVHLPLSSTPDERRQVRLQAQDMGIDITSCGVIYLKNDEALMRQAFDYTRDLGASVVVIGVSREMLPTLNKVISGYDIKAAIHNHGPNDKLFPSPLEAYDAVKNLDKRIGICMDIGHTFRMHEDLVEDSKKLRDRLYSIHFKDLDSDHLDAKGVPVGTGALPVVALLRELAGSGYSGEIQLEYEVEPKDPVPGMAESLGFMRGTLQTLA
jgi:inosose dehydratase